MIIEEEKLNLMLDYSRCCLLPLEDCFCWDWWRRNQLPPFCLQLLCAAAGHK